MFICVAYFLHSAAASLSTGAIVGIVIGVIITVILVLMAVTVMIIINKPRGGGICDTTVELHCILQMVKMVLIKEYMCP